MAFMGRGGVPSIENNNLDNDIDNCGGDRYYRGYRYYRRVYYIPLDNTYVLMQMAVTFIILITGIITFLAVYKSDIIDPIEDIKKMYINIYLAVIVILLAITLIVNFFSKNPSELIKRLVCIAVISIVIMIAFFGVKLNLDMTYNKEKFKQICTEQNIGENSTSKSRIDIGIGGPSLKSEQEHYIDECVKLYNIFIAKSYGTLGIHLLLNILLIFQISRIIKLQGKKDQMSKDDIVLFDEEQDVKI